MKYALAIVQLAFGLALFLCAILPAYPHGLDAYGCYHNRYAQIPKGLTRLTPKDKE